MFISCSFYTGESLTGCDASGHVAEETRNAKYIRSPLPRVSLVDIKLQCRRRPRDIDLHHSQRNHGIRRHNPLPILHSGSKHTLFIECSATVRTDLRDGAREGPLRLHDHYCGDWLAYRDFPSPTPSFHDSNHPALV